jgi:TonB family protein
VWARWAARQRALWARRRAALAARVRLLRARLSVWLRPLTTRFAPLIAFLTAAAEWLKETQEAAKYQELCVGLDLPGAPDQFAWEIASGEELDLGLRWERRPLAFFSTLRALREELPPLPEGAADAFRDADMKSWQPQEATLAVSAVLHFVFLVAPFPQFFMQLPPGQQEQLTAVRIQYDVRWMSTSRVLPPISPTRSQQPSPGGRENEPLPPPGAQRIARQTIVSNPPNPNHPTQTLLQQFGIERARVRAPNVRLPNMVIPPSTDAAPNTEVNLRRMKVPDSPFDLTGPPRSPVVPKPKSRAELALEKTKLENLHARLTLPTTKGGEGASDAPDVNAPLGRARSGDLPTPGVIAISPNPSAPGPVLQLPDTNLRARFAVGPNAGPGSPGGVPGGVPGARGGSGGGPGGEGGGPGGGGFSAPDIYVEPAGPVPPGPVIVAEQYPPPVPAPAPSTPASPLPGAASSRNQNPAAGGGPAAAGSSGQPAYESAEQRARELMEAVRLGPRSPRPVQTTYAFISNLTSQSSTWMIRYAERKGANSNGDGPAHVAQSGAFRLPNITPPQVVKKVDPCYPSGAFSQRVDGTVILYGVIREDGMVQDVTLVQSVQPKVDQRAEQAFAQSFFEPARKNGRAIPVEVLIEIPFRMAACL